MFMRYSRRLLIPVTLRDSGRQVGHLIWQNGAMEAWTTEGQLVGRYATRREAASALWAELKRQKSQCKWTSVREPRPSLAKLSGDATQGGNATHKNSAYAGKS